MQQRCFDQVALGEFRRGELKGPVASYKDDSMHEQRQCQYE
jgi:hypothetical protein